MLPCYPAARNRHCRKRLVQPAAQYRNGIRPAPRTPADCSDPPNTSVPPMACPRRGAIVHGVQVRQHHMAQSQRTHHGIAHFRGEVPRLLAHELRIAGMQSVDRTERAKLVPAGFQMFVAVSAHVTANIVTPPSVADIRRGSSEIRLELQGFPRNNGVSREADRIAVRTRASIPREGERPTVVASRTAHVAFGLLDMHFMLIASARLGALFAFAVLIYIAFGRSLVAPGIQVVQVLSTHSGSSPGWRVTPPCCQSSHQKSTPSASIR